MSSGCRPGFSILRHRTQPRTAGCRPGSSIPSTGSSCEPTYNRRVVSGHQSVSKRRSASGGRRPSWILKKKLQRNVLQLRSRTSVEAYVDRHRHQDRCQCHQEPDRDGSHYPQRQLSGEADRLVVTGPASCRTTPTPTWSVSRDKILVWWRRRAHRSTPPPDGGVPIDLPPSQNSLDEALVYRQVTDISRKRSFNVFEVPDLKLSFRLPKSRRKGLLMQRGWI